MKSKGIVWSCLLSLIVFNCGSVGGSQDLSQSHPTYPGQGHPDSLTPIRRKIRKRLHRNAVKIAPVVPSTEATPIPQSQNGINTYSYGNWAGSFDASNPGGQFYNPQYSYPQNYGYQDAGKAFNDKQSHYESPSIGIDHFYNQNQPPAPTENPYTYYNNYYQTPSSSPAPPVAEEESDGLLSMLYNKLIKPSFESGKDLTSDDPAVNQIEPEPEESIGSIIFQKVMERWRDSDTNEIYFPGKGLLKRMMKFLGGIFGGEEDPTELSEYQPIYDANGNALNSQFLNPGEVAYIFDGEQLRPAPFDLTYNGGTVSNEVERVGAGGTGLLGSLGSIASNYLTLPNIGRVFFAGLAFEGVKRSINMAMDWSVDLMGWGDGGGKCMEKMTCDAWRFAFFEIPNEEHYIDWMMDSNMGMFHSFGAGLNAARGGSDCSEFTCSIYPMGNLMETMGVHSIGDMFMGLFGGNKDKDNYMRESRKESSKESKDL